MGGWVGDCGLGGWVTVGWVGGLYRCAAGSTVLCHGPYIECANLAHLDGIFPIS